MTPTVPVGEMETMPGCNAAGLELKQMGVITTDTGFCLNDSE